jgi:hypothetical protein
MLFDRTRALCVSNWKFLTAAGLLVVTGCRAGASGEDGPIQTFIMDFARQVLAALVL